jgi:hypothetical protein
MVCIHSTCRLCYIYTNEILSMIFGWCSSSRFVPIILLWEALLSHAVDRPWQQVSNIPSSRPVDRPVNSQLIMGFTAVSRSPLGQLSHGHYSVISEL